MIDRHRWTEAYREHTCFKALHRIVELQKRQEVGLVRLQNEIMPCKMCRAWLRRFSRLKGVKVEIQTGEQTWCSAPTSP